MTPEVPLFDLALLPEDLEAALAPMREGWLTMGPRTQAFEAEFARACAVPHAIAVSSGTAALHLSVAALGIGPGDEVICPSLTFVATANAVRYVGAQPVFCDIVGPQNLNLDPADVEARITSRTRAVIAVHFAGYPAAVESLAELCKRRGLQLIEDAAHACISTVDGRACGSFGDAGCFSFFSNKNLSCGEGGVVLTSDDDLAKRIRLMRSHAMTTSTVERHAGRALTYDVVDLGFNYRIDEVRAALLSSQLPRLGAALDARRAAHEGYLQRLEGVGVDVPDFAREGNSRVAHHIFPILLPEGCRRDGVMRSLREQGVQSSVHYPPIHKLSSYAESHPAISLPKTESVAPRELTLPLFASLTPSQQDQVCEALRRSLDAAGAYR
jgi:dTDP-4-amino-4,6-dideoxygalactose transaminase